MLPSASSSDKTLDLPSTNHPLLHTRFEAWTDRNPAAIAVLEEGNKLSYAELDRRSNQIAHALRSEGLQTGNIVAVCLERGADLVCTLLGVLKAGAAFVALDPHSPGSMMARVFATIDCAFVITTSSFAPDLPPHSGRTLRLDTPTWLAGQPESRLSPMASGSDPACVLFTSGSMGHVKAVLYQHQNLISRLTNTAQVSGFDQSSRFAQSSPITSIDAIDEIFLPLVTGGCSVILPHETVRDPQRLIAALSIQKVTHMLLVPSLLRVILAAQETLAEALGALRTWMIGGEPLSAALAHQFYEKLPSAVLINFYGLTEGDATYHITSSLRNYGTQIPIGRPVQNTQVYLLDHELKPVPEGEIGEICIAGQALSHEYVNCPELNAERWVPNPFVSEDACSRLFRTGDLGRVSPEGEIEYAGRRDRMVKIRGFRVELGEVETILSQHRAVEQCVVVSKQPALQDGSQIQHPPYLIAFAVLKTGEATTAQELRDFLKERLPAPSVPAMVFLLETLPLSPNGKVDIHALWKLEPTHRDACKNYVPPRDAIEMQLIRIWESLLHYHPIGVADNFFDIGGDSLTAIDLMLTIEKELRCRLPISVLFEAPTIADLARLVCGGGNRVPTSSLIPIRPQGTRPPLFCIHADGSVFIYRRFAHDLDENIPIFGLQAHGLAEPTQQPYRRVDEMAAHYIREIRTVQAQGPFHLCAFSAGGLIIFEMARQLAAAGESVAFLGFLDAYGPDYPKYLSNASLVDYKISVHLNTLRLHGVKGQMNYLWGRARHRLNLISSRLFAGLLLQLHLPLPRKIRYEFIARLIDQACQMYPAGRTYAGNAVVFQASTQPEGIQSDPTLGWANLVLGNLKIINVSGTHNSIMMHEPHVAALVKQINKQLEEAGSDSALSRPAPERLSVAPGE